MPESSSAAWYDRFTPPDESTLLEPFDPTQQGLLALVREGMAGLGLTERLVHHGVPWRWCFLYELAENGRPSEPGPAAAGELTGGEGEPVAYVIPEPERPRFALPLPEAMLESLSGRRLSKPVREGLMHARLVGGVVWAEWDIAAKSHAEEFCKLTATKLEQAKGPAG